MDRRTKEAADVAKKAPLFRTAPGSTGLLADQRLNRKAALAMIKRGLKAAGLPTNVRNHTAAE